MAVLMPDQLDQLYAWMDKFSDTNIDLSDPKGVMDHMTRTAELLATGQQKPTTADEQAIFKFGQDLYHGMYP
jgi:hypothetical protein